MKKTATLTLKVSLRPRLKTRLARPGRPRPGSPPVRRAVVPAPRGEAMIFLEWLTATHLGL